MLLCCGLTTLDLLQGLDHLPGPDEKVQADWAVLQVGGPAANAALTAQLLGRSSRLVTVLGAGPLAVAASTELTDGGVEVVDATPGGCAWQLPVSTVLVTAGTGERAVVSANTLAAPALDPAPDEVALVALAGVTAVLVDGHHHDLAMAVAAAARRAGLPVLLDGGSWKPGTAALLASVDVAVLSADFRVPGTPATGTLAAVRALGPAVVAQTSGPAPVRVLDDAGSPREIAVPAATEVADTLGAGDVLHGALAAFLADPVARAAGPDRMLGAAAAVATLSCEFRGARGWAGTDDGRNRANAIVGRLSAAPGG